MEQSFGLVLFAVVGIAAVVAIVLFSGSGDVYRQIGKGPLALRDGEDRPAADPAPGSPRASAERELELRQLLAAKNVRRERRGEPPIDVDAELLLLLRPQADAGLEAEIRDMVIARNARRARRGEAPLDVDAEVARRLSELD